MAYLWTLNISFNRSNVYVFFSVLLIHAALQILCQPSIRMCNVAFSPSACYALFYFFHLKYFLISPVVQSPQGTPTDEKEDRIQSKPQCSLCFSTSLGCLFISWVPITSASAHAIQEHKSEISHQRLPLPAPQHTRESGVTQTSCGCKDPVHDLRREDPSRDHYLYLWECKPWRKHMALGADDDRTVNYIISRKRSLFVAQLPVLAAPCSWLQDYIKGFSLVRESQREFFPSPP